MRREAACARLFAAAALLTAALLAAPCRADETPSRFEGPVVSVDFRDTPVHEALKVIAGVKRLNISIDPGVTGRVTMKLNDVPWEQAFELLLRQRSLTVEWLGTPGSDVRVARIMPLATSR